MVERGWTQVVWNPLDGNELEEDNVVLETGHRRRNPMDPHYYNRKRTGVHYKGPPARKASGLVVLK